MKVTHYFTASLTAPTPAVLYAVKGDGARMAVARLMAGAEPWTVPEGVTAGISYTLPDKTPGYYDRLEAGAPACMIAGNLVSAVIAPVLTGQAGAVKASIVLRDADGDQVATFPFQLRVEQAPGIVDAESVPAMGNGFEGKLFYGGPGGALTALALGDGVRVETTEDGTLALVAEGGSGGGGGIDEEKDPTVPAWAKQPQKPAYTAQEVGAMPAGTKIPGKTSELTNDAGFVNKAVNDLTNYYTRQQTQELIAAIPRFRVTVVQQLPAAGEELVLYLVPFATAEGQYLEYIWVDGRWEIIGSQRVDLTGYATEEWVQEYVDEHSGQNLTLDTTLTQSGKAADAKAVGDALDKLEEKIPTKPEDIGAQPKGNYASPDDIPKVPSWAMQTSKPGYTASEVGADTKGTAASAVSEHNTSGDAHTDLRLEVKALREQLKAFLDVDEETLNELSELIAAIAANQTSISQLTTGKVSVADIVNNLTTNVANKPLSAAQGVVIKALIDNLSASLPNYQPKGDYALASAVPTKVSQLSNDKGYLTEHQDISGKLDKSELPTAINTALAQAKTRGEFDGADGKTAYQYAQDGGYAGTEEEFAALMAGNLMEPADDDMPKVFLTGDEFTNMTKDKNEVSMEMDYVSKTDTFHAYILIKWQGNTSLNFAKKNFTVKLYSDEARGTKLKKAFRDWKYAKHKFVLKANWIDHTHARNIVCANLWNEVVASRSDYDTLPEELRNSPKNGAVDGFPVKLYVNGTYQGVYTWNIGKDDWQWGMDEDNTSHALLCVTHNTNGVFKDRPYNFRALWSGVDNEAFEIEVGTNSDALKNGVNAMLSCIINNNGAAFKTSIGQYLDVQSAIDYYLHQYVICGLDGLAKNILLGSYNLTKWYLGAYDMDATFGLWYDGSKFVSTNYKCPEDYQEKFNLLFERLEENFWQEIQARYAELRKSAYSFANLCSSFERFTAKIGSELFAEDLEVFPGIPQGNTNNIKHLRVYIRDRLAYCDEQILNGVPGTGVVLSNNAPSIAVGSTATLAATVTPANTTDEVFWWSDNTAIATVNNGVITPVAVGNCTIYAKCGSGYASCAVTVAATAEPEPAYINQVPLSIGTDKNVYNGTGYKDGYRLSSSGSEKENEWNTVTGYIPAKSGGTIRIKGYKWYDTTASMNYLNAYKSDFGFLYAACPTGGYGTDSLIETMSYDDTTGVSTVKLKSVADMAYIRICVWDGNGGAKGANLIVTVNQEIV